MVNGPNLPKNIIIVSTALPKTLKYGVMPRLKPTVPNALKDSNIKDSRAMFGSKIVNKKVIDTIQITEIRITAKARLATSLAILLPAKFISSVPFIMPIKDNIMMPNVVVLIPPAVEPGEPPINIKIMVMKRVGIVKPFKSNVLYPAVLGVTEAKNDATTFWPKVKSPIVFGLLYRSEERRGGKQCISRWWPGH